MVKLANVKLYRLSDKRVFGGVCAGLAQYLGMPVTLVRALTVLALIVSFGVTLIIYIVMCFAVESVPSNYYDENNIAANVSKLLNEIDAKLNEGEMNLRQMERYITSDSFSINSKFRKL